MNEYMIMRNVCPDAFKDVGRVTVVMRMAIEISRVMVVGPHIFSCIAQYKAQYKVPSINFISRIPK